MQSSVVPLLGAMLAKRANKESQFSKSLVF